MGRTRLLVLLACAMVFAVGGVLVYVALRETPPEATPVPEQEFSLSREEALAVDPEVADRPVALPTGQDLGPYVNTRPVAVPDGEAVTAAAPDGETAEAGDALDGETAEAGDALGGETGETGDALGGGAGEAGGEATGLADPASHLYIPSLYVSAPVVPQGVTSSNEMSLPDNLHHVGLLDTTSPLDAGAGSTLIAGHVTAGGHPGALYLLGRVQPGASVSTVDAAGQRTDWVVTSVRNYHKTSLPAEIFRTNGERKLTLVTCGGDIIRTPDGRWTHEDNIVVTATPAA